MKKTWFALVILIVGLCPVVYGQELQKDAEQNYGNLKYLHFNSLDPKDLESIELGVVIDETGKKVKPNQSWLKNREGRWIQAFEKVAVMLPESFFEKIGETSWTFFIDQENWATAYGGLFGGQINLLPSLKIPDSFKFEPAAANGYSQEEMMFVALHELGHVYDSSVQWGIEIPLEAEPTFYGSYGGQAEDFAETFALYVLWPEYLKNNFPRHYELGKTILVREYKTTYPMPRSISSRLTVKDHVANSH